MVRIVPLGGLGEIGLNAMVIESADERILVDCGVLFPTAEMPGVDLVLPDWRYLLEEPKRLKAVVLTHAHEDHLGALPYFLRELPVPVYGTKLTLAFLEHRLEEQGASADLREMAPRHSFEVGERLIIEPLTVCHTIPDAVGLAVRTPFGTVVHTGDFKLDDDPLDGVRTDLERLRALADEGVLCLLSDSTNAETERDAGSERTVAAAFDKWVTHAPGRVVIGLFASNLGRVQHVLELAARVQRRVVLLGRAMARNVELGQRTGRLRVPNGLLIDAAAAALLRPEQVLVLATGAQAEARSGLRSLVEELAPLSLGKGDRVLLSARAIPGHERQIGDLINLLCERGADVVHPGLDPDVHVSGHAGRRELERMIRTVRPQHFVPIHGELRQLLHHLSVASRAGLAKDQLCLMRDGHCLTFADDGSRAWSGVTYGRVLKSRTGGGVSQVAVGERLLLGETGVVVVTAVLAAGGGRLLQGPFLEARGLSADEQSALIHGADEVKALFTETSEALRGDDALVRDELVRSVRRMFRRRGQRRPTVVPVVIRL